jgi:YVTN family beta-propeller protein
MSDLNGIKICRLAILVALGAASSSAASLAYVPARTPAGLRVLDTTTNTVVATIPFTDNPSEVVVTPDGQFAYVSIGETAAGGFGSSVAVISTATNSVIDSISVGEQPEGLAITPDGRFVYVANANWDTVWVISTTSNSVVATIPVGRHPLSAAVTPDGAFVYVANVLSNNVSVISVATNTVVSTISVGAGAGYLAVAPDGAFVYSSNYVSGNVSVIDTATNTVISTITTAPNSRGIAITPDGKTVYVTSGTAAAGFFVSAIDTASHTVTANIAETAAGALGQVAVSPDGSLVYVSDSGATTLTLISTATNTVTGTIEIGRIPGAVAFAPIPGASLAISSVTLHPPSIPGGAPASGFVTLNAAAPSSGVSVSLLSDNASVNVPASVTVPAGSKIAAFTAATIAVSDDTPVTVTATYNGSSETGTITVTPAGAVSVASVSVDPVTVVGGVPATGSVMLSGAAPAGGILVDLWTDGAPAYVPASVTVPAGSSVATFPVTTMSTTSSQADTITAFYLGVTKTTTITVLPALAISSLSAPGAVTGGESASGYVNLNTPAPPGGVVVSLWTSGFPAFVPSSVTIAGGSTSAGFIITTAATPEAAQPVITAFYNGVSKTITLTVNAAAGLTSVSASPGTVIAGEPATGAVTLNAAAPAGGLVVDLWTNGSPAFVPASVTVPADATTATFPVTTMYTATGAESTITAFCNGIKKTATLTVSAAPTLASITAPESVTAGNSLTGSVSLAAPAPQGGVAVSLWTSGAPAFVPASVTIPVGSTSANFTITTMQTSATAHPVITGFLSGVSKTVTLTVTPAIALSSVSVFPATVTGGTSTTGTVTLTSAAPAGGLAIELWTDGAPAFVPVSVTVPAGATTATFPVTTMETAAATQDAISAFYNGVALSTHVMVTP